MLRLLLAAVLTVIAMPAQAITLTLYTTISGQDSTFNPRTGQSDVTPIGPFDAAITLTGSLSEGFNSYFAQCNAANCLKATVSGNEVLLRTGDNALPCYCFEEMVLTFDSAFTGDLSLFSNNHFVSGRYSFSGGHGLGSTSLSGDIVALSVPEPATWMMMIGGLGLIGGIMRRRTAGRAYQVSRF